jgi:hypothetical protein
LVPHNTIIGLKRRVAASGRQDMVAIGPQPADKGAAQEATRARHQDPRGGLQ